MKEYDYIIGGVKYRIISPFELTVEARWQRFAANFEVPDHSYYLKFVSDEISPPESVDFVGEWVRCGKLNGNPYRVYYRSNHEPYAAVTEESSSVWNITLRQDHLPWGSHLEHMFVQYGLPRTLLLHGSLLLHGAYILTDYGAVVFTAPSGTGKTTQAELWRLHRQSRIINGDRVILSCHDRTALAHSLIHSGSSEDCENVTAPLAAIVSLAQAKENHVTPLHGMQALRALLRGSYLLPEFREDADRTVALSQQLCSHVPVLQLACVPDVSAVEILEQHLAAIVGAK